MHKTRVTVESISDINQIFAALEHWSVLAHDKEVNGFHVATLERITKNIRLRIAKREEEKCTSYQASHADKTKTT